MKFEPGAMGVTEGLGLVFMTTGTRIFLTTPSESINSMASAAWASPLIAGFAALVSFWLLSYAQQKTGGDLIRTAGLLLGKPAAFVIGLFYLAAFFVDAIWLLRQFAENTLITALPYANYYIIVGWYGLCTGIMVYLGIEAMGRAAYIVMPISILALVFLLLLLIPFYDYHFLAPWLGNGLGLTLKNSFSLTGLDLGVLLLIIFAPSFQTARTRNQAALLVLVLGNILRALSIACFIMAFGVAMGAERTLPFYEMSRLVYLSRYVQRIEALFILLWVIIGLLAIAIDLYITLYLFARLAKLNTIRPLIVPTVLISIQLASLPRSVSTVLLLDKYSQSLFNVGLLVIPPLLFLAALLKRKDPSKCSCRES
ncbi:spore germination gerab [Lucifera butyrica]|uniref:Spore germination gerab n=1 Tax=Lucifera butyrica TaxID=1351585 RepID=A0A498RC02_9FIRM|nr:GerAB/ArcD/ProY family transporter [Lucifera butyrica]VBB07663.1 spore germination gerab [Lucifera butyrica]